jgi:G protein-coupled receptor GPR1
MVREARAAYRRRDEEMAIQQQRLESASLSGQILSGENRRTERSWWEVAGLDAGMSPLTEETPNLTERGNPMEEVRTASPARTDRNANALKINVIPPSSPEFTNSTQNENNGAKPEKKI